MNLVINASEAIGERSGVITISTGAMECDAEYLRETYLRREPAAGTVRHPGGVRHRQRHGRDDAEPHLRAVLHHQVHRPRPGPVRRARASCAATTERSRSTASRARARPSSSCSRPRWRRGGACSTAPECAAGRMAGQRAPSSWSTTRRPIRALGSRMLEKLGFSVLLALGRPRGPGGLP